MIEIPERLKPSNFVLIGNEKKPFEKAWTKKIHRFDCPVLKAHLEQNRNYGVQSNDSFIQIEGKNYFLVVVDFDKRDFQDKIASLLPATFTTTSGSPKNCYHLWFACDDNKAFKIKNENGETLCDILGGGNQVVAPGSKHSSGSTYSVVKDIPFAFISYSELEAVLKPHDRTPKKIVKEKALPKIKSYNENVMGEIINSFSMESLLSEFGVDTSKNPTNCPTKHPSLAGKCFSWGNELCHCFNCKGSWNKFSLVRDILNLSDKQTFEWFAEKSGRMDELKNERKKFVKEERKNFDFSIEAMIDAFLDKYPIFFDKARILWRWNFGKYLWEQIDATDLGILISSAKKEDIYISKKFSDVILERARLRIPENPKTTWVQFKSKVYDFVTGESFEASPKYFITNPIPFDLGKSENTPNIDKLCDEWVGKAYVKTLYQILAYSLTPNKFMQRLIALVGGGSNGKSTFISLVQRLIGKVNYTCSELKLLAERNFETAILYKKLLCIIGEVAYDDLSNTSQLKKLSGEDDIRFEFKGKQPFSDKNSASIVCLTNSLPRTPDRSLGFYRRWLIIDFLNQFPVGENPIDKISDSEMSNLALKCFNLLKQLYLERKFENEGTYEEREATYEEKSNPIIKFIEQNCEDTPGKHIVKRVFLVNFNVWLRLKHQRPLSAHQVASMLRSNGYEIGSRKVEGESTQVVVNCSFKTPITINTINTQKNPISSYIGKTSSKKPSICGNCGNDDFSNISEVKL